MGIESEFGNPSDQAGFAGPYSGKPAVQKESGNRGNVGIIGSPPVRASILADQHGGSPMQIVEAQPPKLVIRRCLANEFPEFVQCPAGNQKTRRTACSKN